MGEGLGQVFGCLVTIAIIGFICTIGFTGYTIYDKTGTQTYESKVVIEPDYRLEANGKNIDTIYIYEFKKK